METIGSCDLPRNVAGAGELKMQSWRTVIDRLKGHRTRQEEDLEHELRTHLDLEAEEQQESGVASEERALNQPAVAFAIESGSHSGASRQ